MKILLYGAAGAIGHAIKQHFNSITSQAQIIPGLARCQNYPAVVEEISRLKPDVVISSIGRTYGPGCPNIDYLEQPGRLKDNLRDNLQAPLNLALACQHTATYLVYIGTGCIFEYDQAHPQPPKTAYGYDCRQVIGFKENDLPNFTGSSYSTVKGVTDQLMARFDHVLNVRIRMPIFGRPHKRDFITKILAYPKLIDIPNSMTVIPEMMPVLATLIEKRITGTVNLVNPGVMSPSGVIDLYNQYHPERPHQYQVISLSDLDGMLAARRSNNYLEPSPVVANHPGVRPLREAILEIIREY